MASIQASAEIYDIKEDSEKFRYIQLFLQAVKQVVNGRLEFSTNVKFSPVTVEFTAANTSLLITHGLSRVPKGYLVVSKSADMTIYGDNVNISLIANSSTITLKSSATGTCQILFL